MKKLYLKLFKWARGKLKEQHLQETGCDLKCHFCKQWYSISKLEPVYKPKSVNVEFGWGIKCVNCGKMNYWNLDIAPFPVAANKKGVPLA